MTPIIITVNPHDRLQLSTTIENLIAMLDDLSPDPDLEDGADAEPWLGWPANGLGALVKEGVHDDREAEDEHDEDGGDREANGDELDFTGDEGDYGRCEDDALARELYGLSFGTLMGGQGL